MFDSLMTHIFGVESEEDEDDDDDDDDVDVGSGSSVGGGLLSQYLRMQRQSIFMQHQSTFAAAPEPRRIPAKPKETKVSKNVKEGNEKSGLSNDAPAGPSAITCAVCLELATNMMVTHCGHVFCNECICDTIKEFKKCPICRTKLTRSKIHPIYL